MELFNRLSLSYIGSEPLCPVVMGCDLVHGAVAATKIRLSWNIGRREGGVTCLHIVITFFLMN